MDVTLEEFVRPLEGDEEEGEEEEGSVAGAKVHAEGDNEGMVLI